MKTKKKIAVIIAALAVITAAIIVTSIKFFNWSCDRKESLRISSPDGIVDAVVIESDCGATTGTASDVFIVPKGQMIKTGLKKTGAVASMDDADELSVSWAEPKTLTITYKSARIYHFTNFWQNMNIENGLYIVSITERKK